jgi:sugar lactone lactonase YvrE
MGRSRRARTAASLCTGAALWLAPAPALAVPDCPGVQPARTLLSGQGVLESVIADRRGRLIYSDGTKKAFMRLDAPGAQPRVLAGDIEAPGGLALDADGTLIAGYGDSVANGARGAADPQAGLLRIDPETGARSTYAAPLQMANGVARGPDGTVYASNDVGTSLDRVLPDRTIQLGWAPVDSGNGLAVDSTGRYLFANQTFRPAAVRRVDLRTGAVSLYAQPPAEDIAAGLDGMAIDQSDRLFLAANGGGQIWRVDADRTICALARGLTTPSAVNFGSAAPGAPGFPSTSLYFVTFGGVVGEIPGARPAPAAAAAPRPRLSISVSPFQPAALEHLRLRLRVRSVPATGRARYLRGATVRIGRRTALTDAAGRASLAVFLRRGQSLLRATAPGHRQAKLLIRAR